jgi:hypothetical protein
MELLGDMGHVESCFGLFGDSVSVGAGWVHNFLPNVRQAQKSFWTHPMELQGDVGHVESHFGPFGESVGVGATIGLEIILEAPGGTPRG